MKVQIIVIHTKYHDVKLTDLQNSSFKT